MRDTKSYEDVSDEIGKQWYHFDKNATARDYRVQAAYWQNKEQMDRAIVSALLSVSKAVEEQKQ